MFTYIFESFWYKEAIDWCIRYAPKVFFAFLILWGGVRFGRILLRGIDMGLQRGGIETGARKFLVSFSRLCLYLLLIILAATTLGFEMTSFVAILGAAGLAVGLALQGSLANFAGGLLIMFFKPYVIGDFISVKGEKGTVDDITIFTTKLITPEWKEAIIPNGKIVDDTIINMTREGKIRVDVSVGVAYDTDLDYARSVLLSMLSAHSLVLKEPSPAIHVNQLADSSINLIVRSYCHPGDYRTVFFETTEGAKKALDAAHIHIPFPQRVVHTVAK